MMLSDRVAFVLIERGGRQHSSAAPTGMCHMDAMDGCSAALRSLRSLRVGLIMGVESPAERAKGSDGVVGL
jgi:hypothetical protein